MNNFNPRKIAKNTLILYIRMFFVMILAFFTTRVVLLSLGIDDYGTYTIVGGIVTLFGFITLPLISATQRFINFELGQNNYKKVTDVFNASSHILIVITILLFILLETIGYYYISHFLVVPPGRLEAAKWVYHFSVASFCLSILSTPFQAFLLAYEDITKIAYIEIGQSIAKLAIAYQILYTSFDKLIFYSILILFITFLTNISYIIYCSKYSTFKIALVKDKSIYKEISSFAGWSLFESVSGILKAYGSNILLNFFYGSVINASYGIARQVNLAVSSFSTNYMKAANPQITQSFSSNDKDYSYKLVFYSSKFCFYLIWIISTPFLIEMNWILNIWLKNPPINSSIFCILMLIDTLIDMISYPLLTFILATGKIKMYQISIGLLTLLNIPISFGLLRLGFQSYSIFIVGIAITVLCLIVKLNILKKIDDFPSNQFYIEVILKILLIVVTSLIIPFIIISLMKDGWIRFVLISFTSTIVNTILIYSYALNSKEQTMIIEYLLKLRRKLFNLNIFFI